MVTPEQTNNQPGDPRASLPALDQWEGSLLQFGMIWWEKNLMQLTRLEIWRTNRNWWKDTTGPDLCVERSPTISSLSPTISQLFPQDVTRPLPATGDHKDQDDGKEEDLLLLLGILRIKKTCGGKCLKCGWVVCLVLWFLPPEHHHLATRTRTLLWWSVANKVLVIETAQVGFVQVGQPTRCCPTNHPPTSPWKPAAHAPPTSANCPRSLSC